MKKSICILLSLIFLISALSACNDNGGENSSVSKQTSDLSLDESSENVSEPTSSDTSDETSDETSGNTEIVIPPQENRMLLGTTYDSNLFSFQDELSFGLPSSFVDEALVGDVLDYDFGVDDKPIYEKSSCNDHLDYTIHHYNGKGYSASINAKTGQIVRLSFGSLNTHGIKTIKFDEIHSIVNDFIEKYYPNRFNLDTPNVKYDDDRRRYTFEYNNYSEKRTDILIETLRIVIDRCGNLFRVDYKNYPCVPEKLPDWTDEAYMEDGIATIKLFYNALGIDANLEPTAVTMDAVSYHAQLDTYYLLFELRYKVPNTDGTITETLTYLYLPYADSSDIAE